LLHLVEISCYTGGRCVPEGNLVVTIVLVYINDEKVAG